MNYDTIVIGGGVVGASTADALLRRGQRVLLIEQFRPGHNRGSSHGDGRIIRFAYPEPIYVEMAKLAYAAWDALSERTGEHYVIKSGGWDCGPHDSAELAEIEENFVRYGIPYERLSAAESNARFPQFHLPEGSEGIYQEDAGVVRATPAVEGLWRAIAAQEGDTLTDTRIEDIEIGQDKVTVRTVTGDTYEANKIVVAAGGWSQKLLASTGLELPLVATQELVAYFPAKDKVNHRVGTMPVFIDYHTPDAFYGLPHIDVPGVKVGWHHTGPALDPDHREHLNRPEVLAPRIEVLQRYIAERFPHLDSTAPFAVTECLYTNTPDYHFVLDYHPNSRNVIIGTGFSGHGFKFGPTTGDLLASLVVEETPALSLDMFRIARFHTPELLKRRTNA